MIDVYETAEKQNEVKARADRMLVLRADPFICKQVVEECIAFLKFIAIENGTAVCPKELRKVLEGDGFDQESCQRMLNRVRRVLRTKLTKRPAQDDDTE